MILGWETEDPFQGDDDVLFSQRCHLACVRDSKWRQEAEGCAELAQEQVYGKVRFEMRHEKGYAFAASFFAVCAPPFGGLVPVRAAGWKFFVIDCSWDDPRVQQFVLFFASNELVG